MTHRRHRATLFAGLLVMCAGAFTPAFAQTTADVTPGVHEQRVSTNPFGLMFEWFNVEYERRLTGSTTWGASLSTFSRDADSFDYLNTNALIRHYPGGEALSGFFLGGRGGVFRVSDHRESETCFGLGFEIGYEWLLGKKRNVGIGLGVGAVRLFGGDLEGASVVLPTVRLLNLGIAF